MSDQKNDWFEEESKHSVQVRHDATYKFWEKLEADSMLRSACTDTSDPTVASELARRTLEEAGNFEKIPDNVVVRVFESDRTTADNIVTIVLPSKNDPALDPEHFDETLIWRCSWNLWITKPPKNRKKAS